MKGKQIDCKDAELSIVLQIFIPEILGWQPGYRRYFIPLDPKLCVSSFSTVLPFD
jgi:hypothetical protein